MRCDVIGLRFTWQPLQFELPGLRLARMRLLGYSSLLRLAQHYYSTVRHAFSSTYQIPSDILYYFTPLINSFRDYPPLHPTDRHKLHFPLTSQSTSAEFWVLGFGLSLLGFARGAPGR